LSQRARHPAGAFAFQALVARVALDDRRAGANTHVMHRTAVLLLTSALGQLIIGRGLSCLGGSTE